MIVGYISIKSDFPLSQISLRVRVLSLSLSLGLPFLLSLLLNQMRSNDPYMICWKRKGELQKNGESENKIADRRKSYTLSIVHVRRVRFDQV